MYVYIVTAFVRFHCDNPINNWSVSNRPGPEEIYPDD